MLPKYLIIKLKNININNESELFKHNYYKIFQWLKHKEPSLSYHTLFDLYCVYNRLPINSLSKQFQKEILLKYRKLLPSYLLIDSKIIDNYLEECLKQASYALDNNEIPIGAIIVKDSQIIATGFNQTIRHGNILGHAEIVALNKAQHVLGNYRLDGCDLYVTIEPCLMCVGAIIQSRIKRIIFGAKEPKTGAIVSQYKVLKNKLVNHHTEALGPIDNEYYKSILQQFLKQKRKTS